MNGPSQHGMIPSAALPPATESTPTASSRWREARKSLIATVPRLEIVVTPSYKWRKHFLIATRNGGCSAAGTTFFEAETAKISRKPGLVESLVSHSKQRTLSQINRQLSACPAERQKTFPAPHTMPLALRLSGRLQKRAKNATILGYLHRAPGGFHDA